MTVDQRQIDALTTFEFFKNDPEIAARILAPPPPGSGRYKKAKSLQKLVRTSARELARSPLDPFGRLSAALDRLVPKLRELEDATNPNDPLLQLRRLMVLLNRSISRNEERVRVRDFGADFDELARTVIYIPPMPDFNLQGQITGYVVDVDGVRTVRAELGRIAAGADGSDVRLAVALAFETLLTALLWPVNKHFGNQQAGTTLRFFFDEDPDKYGYHQE